MPKPEAYENSLSLAFLLLFLVSIAVHAWGGLAEINDGRLEHGRAALSMGEFLRGGGETAAFSLPVPFSVLPRRPAQRSAYVRPGGLFSSGAQAMGGGVDGPPSAGPAAPPAPADIGVCPRLALAAGDGVCKELAVPVIRHQKDTRMLTLEAPNEEPPMGWDKPDFAEYPYCARAGVAMVNAYYHTKLNVPGQLSQDRIGYEVFRHLPGAGGPEYDLPVVGISNNSTHEYSLPLALGTSGVYHGSPEPFREQSIPPSPCSQRNRALGCGRTGPCPPCPLELRWAWGYEALRNIKAEIDAERPLIVTGPGHLYLIVGYVEKGDELSIITQDGGGRVLEDLQQNSGETSDWVDGASVVTQLDGNEAVSLQLLLDAYWTGLAPVKLGKDEQSVREDSDGDGVVDYDEEVRFETKTRERDSDGDGIGDKEEIHYSVWDPDHGYHKTVTALSPYADEREVGPRAENALREAMEIIQDNDQGGCKDGEEDLNANGIRDPEETSNFVRGDDPSTDDGCGLWTGTVETHFRTRQEEHSVDWHIVAQVRLREVNFVPLIDYGPGHGGGQAGKRVGSQVHLECAGTTFQESYRQEIWRRGDDYRQICTASGTETIEAGSGTYGLIFRKSADVDMTPLLGFDMPKGGGVYTFSCSPGSVPELPMSCTCSGNGCQGPHSDLIPWTGPAGVGGAPAAPYRGCYDPEVRFLAGGGNQMTGTYTYDREPGDCVPYHAAVSWSLAGWERPARRCRRCVAAGSSGNDS